jgi:hypothetical protein
MTLLFKKYLSSRKLDRKLMTKGYLYDPNPRMKKKKETSLW